MNYLVVTNEEIRKILAGTLARNVSMAAWRQTNHQRTKAARHVGISRGRLYRRMEALGINPNDISS